MSAFASPPPKPEHIEISTSAPHLLHDSGESISKKQRRYLQKKYKSKKIAEASDSARKLIPVRNPRCEMKLTIAAVLQALPVYSMLGHPSRQPCERVCVVESAGLKDSAPAIVQAFQDCGHNNGAERGKVVFKNETYHVKSVMNTTGLHNVDIDLHGKLLWDTNIPYWLNHSLPVGYQNQSSAWLFGGESVAWNGFGYGTLDGQCRTGNVLPDILLTCCGPRQRSGVV